MLDVQGTLIDDRKRLPIGSSVKLLEKFNEEGHPYILVTNNTKLESGEFKSYLRSLGFMFDDNQYLDPLMVLDRLLPPAPVAAYGSQPFLEVLEKRGYRLDFERPEAVLIGIKENFTNEEYAQMIELVLGGAKLIGMHETSIYSKNGRRYPGVGAILNMVSFATGAEYEVVGKPSPSFFKEALRLLQKQRNGLDFKDVEIVSDDLVGDLMGAMELGMHATLVLSGKIASVEEVKPLLENETVRVASDIGTLFNMKREKTA